MVLSVRELDSNWISVSNPEVLGFKMCRFVTPICVAVPNVQLHLDWCLKCGGFGIQIVYICDPDPCGSAERELDCNWIGV